jgi:hypothetical protein
VIQLQRRKWLCRERGRSFWQRFPGIQPRMWATERFRRAVCEKNFDSISSQPPGAAGAVVERHPRATVSPLSGTVGGRADGAPASADSGH